MSDNAIRISDLTVRYGRMIAVDHASGRTYCIAVSLDEDDAREAESWLAQAQAEVGRTLGLSPYTVTRHLANVYERLGVSRRAQAVAFLAR